MTRGCRGGSEGARPIGLWSGSIAFIGSSQGGGMVGRVSLGRLRLIAVRAVGVSYDWRGRVKYRPMGMRSV